MAKGCNNERDAIPREGRYQQDATNKAGGRIRNSLGSNEKGRSTDRRQAKGRLPSGREAVRFSVAQKRITPQFKEIEDC